MKTWLALATAAAFAAEAPGLRPRPEVSDYPAQQAGTRLTIAAEVLTADAVEKNFATDLNKGWYVVEVAVYPQKDSVAIDTADFMLRVERDGQKSLVRPAGAKAIAGALQRKEAAPADSAVTLHPTVGVGYESGPGYYDPVTGSRRGGGLRTGVGIGVAVGQSGPPPPASTPGDRATMELELSEKALPDGAFVQPVAGYLYFARPAGKARSAALELHYYGAQETVKLPLNEAIAKKQK